MSVFEPVAGTLRSARVSPPSTSAADVTFSVTSTSVGTFTLVSSLTPAAVTRALMAYSALAATTVVYISPPTLTVRTASGSPPQVGAITLTPAPGAAGVSSSDLLVLRANLTSFAPASSWRLAWSAVAGPALNLSDSAKVGTALNGTTLGLLPGALAPSSTYVFRFTATDANGLSMRDVRLSTMALPVGGVLSVSPASGSALSTPFALRTERWADLNVNGTGLPLSFIFSYVVTDAAGAQSHPVLLSTYLLGHNATRVDGQLTLPGVLLPTGNITLQVTAKNALGGVAPAPATAQVTVTPQVFASATQQSAFLSNVASLAGNLSGTAAVSLLTSAATMLNGANSLLNADPAAAAATRETLLLAVGSATSAAATSPAGVEAVALAVSALVSNTGQLSPGGANAALAALGTVASAPGGNVTAAAATNIAGGLSSIVGAALSPESPVNRSVLGNVLDVVNSLASAQLGQLSVPGSPPTEVSSPAINMSVALDTPTQDSRLFYAPVTAPGAKSSFDPLPASVFSSANAADAASGIATQFKALGFDPYDLTTGSSTRTGVTSLSFSSAGGKPLSITAQRVPITMTLPVLPAVPNEEWKALCQFWDEAARPPAYSSVGCTVMPNPRPPGHDAFWEEGFEAATDADIVMAWSVVGPLWDDNCTAVVLDCSRPGKQFVYPDRADPLNVPRIECNQSVSTDPMRIIVGPRCRMTQPNNELNCSWANNRQAFVGAGCVRADEPVKCKCRHLTDFAGQAAPSLPTASLSDMVGLNPADIITKLKLLFEVVIILFGIMNLGAAVGFTMDMRERRTFLERLQTDKMGYREDEATGAWVWRFQLDPLVSEFQPPSGTAVELCHLLGLPAARLRAALPDELLPSWDLACALGRRDAFSKAGMCTALAHRRATKRLAKASRKMQAPLEEDALPARDPDTRSRHLLHLAAATVPGNPEVTHVASAPDVPECTPEEVMMEEFVGTAVVFGFLQAASLLPVTLLADRLSAAKRHFDGTLTPAGWDWAKTQVDLVTLMSPGIINTKAQWLIRARLFKLILSQHPNGYWDPCTTTAFVLEARRTAETAALKPTLLQRITEVLGAAAEALDDDGDGRRDGDDDPVSSTVEALTGAREERAGGPLPDDMAAETIKHQPSLRRAASLARVEQLTDCPLTCSVHAITEAMPRRLSKVLAEDPEAQVGRVWTTLCCISFLERLKWCWVWGDGEMYPPEERTIVDAAREWVEAHAAEHPGLAAALEDGAVKKRAGQVTLQWRRACEARVGELRRSEPIRDKITVTHLHRTAVNVLHACYTQHSTLATFLSEPLDGLQRWQMFMLLITLIMSQLLVNIWMYYAKAQNCCTEIRAILDAAPEEGADVGASCPPLTSLPCRGFVGNCAELQFLFAEMPVLPDWPDGLTDYVCHQFPDEDRQLDSFLVGLISIAVGLPVTLFISTCFAIANDSECPESWLEWVGWRKLVFGLHANRRWHYTGPAGQPNRHVKWFCRSIGAPPSETAANLVRSFWAWVTCSEPAWIEEWRESLEEEEPEEDQEEKTAAKGEDEDAYPHNASTDDVDAPEAGGGTRMRFLMQLANEAEAGDVKAPSASSDTASVSSSMAEARELATYKRTVMAVGLGSVYITWALFAWFIFVYGMLIYKLLGEQAESEFARSWGISYGMNAATEWKDIVQETIKAAIILAILERLCLTRNASWLEDHIDYLSVHALLIKHKALSLYQKIALQRDHLKRLID